MQVCRASPFLRNPKGFQTTKNISVPIRRKKEEKQRAGITYCRDALFFAAFHDFRIADVV
jgi:hypothetical protein